MESYLTAQIFPSAVAHNIKLLKSVVAPAAAFCAVVKADCYGHSLELLYDVIAANCDCMAVAAPVEAIAVRRLGYKRPVLLFAGPCAFADQQRRDEALDELVKQEITLTVVSPDEVAMLAEATQRTGMTAAVHIKLDSGMGRRGASPEQLQGLVRAIRRRPQIRLTGMYTHFASADDADKTFANEQLKRFQAAVQSAGLNSGIALHTSGSAATVDLPGAHLSMVRPGISLYGYQAGDQIANRLPLRPALRLVGPIMQIKDAPAGSTCGYGCTYRFTKAGRVGLVPIGYADGYFRSHSNRACFRVAGKDAPIRGRISMDQTIIDLTDIPQAKVGGEVEIISSDPAAPNSVENLARLAGTIPHEITCRLGPRIRRVRVD